MKSAALLIFILTSALPKGRAFAPSHRSMSAHISPSEKPQHVEKKSIPDLKDEFGKNTFASLVTSFLIFSNFAPAFIPGGEAVADSRLVGEIAGSGLVFKDTLNVESFDDPKVKGVTLYISNFQRPLTERIQKDFFSDPSFASVGCAKTGPVSIADNIGVGKQGEEVFEESRSLLFKTLRVQRIYDKEKNTIE